MPLSRPLADRLVARAADLGIAVKPFGMVFGAGATDAAESAGAGIASTTVIGVPTPVVRAGLVRHTPRDTAERVEPAAVEARLRTCCGCRRTSKPGAGNRAFLDAARSAP